MAELDFDQLKEEEWTFLEDSGVSYKGNQAENLILGWVGKNKAAEPG